MDITNSLRAEVLTQALPYIQKYSGKYVVIKYGGNAMTSEDLKEKVMGDIVLLHQVGIRVVLVHGGGPEISGLLKKVGKRSEFVNGLRVTDSETIDYVTMALAGKVNKNLVNLLQSKGGLAMGLSGMDGRLIEATEADERLGFVGEITKIHTQPILDVLEKGYIPVICSLGCDKDGNTYNINADTAAARIAGALGAACMIAMTDVDGILRDQNDPSSLIRRIYPSDAERLKAEGVISGGMIPKVDCCLDALRQGVRKVFILNGCVPHSILLELLTDEGAGTMVREDEK